MKRKALGYALVLLAGLGLGIFAGKGLSKEHVKMTPYLQEDLGGLDGQEAIVGLLEVTSEFSFPKHYHPGTELSYVLEGSLVLDIEGRPPVTLKAGQVFHVPYRKVHSGQITGVPFKLLIFRIHTKGQPVRINVE